MRSIIRPQALGLGAPAVLTALLALVVVACAPTQEPGGNEESASPGSARNRALPDVEDLRQSRIEIQSEFEIPSASGEVVIWTPIPSDNAYQTIENLRVEGPGEPVFTREGVDGNRLATFRLDNPEAGPVKIKVSFDLERRERDVWANEEEAASECSLANPTADLEPDRLTPITPAIRKIAESQAGQVDVPLEKARRLYDWTVENMSYDKSGDGWGRGDAIWACDARRGNCTDFHSLFMAMARSEQIPARFVMGFPLPADQEEGEVGGYHCWAEVHIPGEGWVPVDASEAAKNRDYEEYYFGRLTPHRFVVATGRDLELEPPQSGEPLNFLYEPYVEADGKPLPDVDTKVRFGPSRRS